MRALLGWTLALGLIVTPALARPDGAGGNAEAADSTAAASNDAPASDAASAANEGPATPSSSVASEASVSMPADSALPPSPAAAPAAADSSSQPPAARPEPQTASEPNSPISFKIGGADFTPVGFMDLTNVFRTKTVGSGIGTNFASAPFSGVGGSYPNAALTEDRFSAQNSRIGLRVDSNVAGGKVLGYVEADFLGNAAGSLSITSNSDTLRLRLYFVDYRRGMFEFLAGQDWSMLTPSRVGIDPMPSGIFYSQDMDTNYQVGLVWERTPQFRFIFHPNNVVTFGFSMENPDQYLGGNGGVGIPVTPSAFNLTQVDTGAGSGVSTPNVRPDIVAKLAFDPKIGGRLFHIDIAGVSRQFRVASFFPATATTAASTVSSGAEGGGGSININFELFKNFHLIENAFWSSGGGRDIFDLVPDFIVTPQPAGGSFGISPLKAGSGIAGFEWQAVPKTMIYGYYGTVYAGRDVSLQPATGSTCQGHVGFSCLGYGFTGSANSNNRTIQEGTIGWIQTLWKSNNYGALQIITQASYLQRNPWYVAPNNSKSAQLVMGFVDVRYVLP